MPELPGAPGAWALSGRVERLAARAMLAAMAVLSRFNLVSPERLKVIAGESGAAYHSVYGQPAKRARLKRPHAWPGPGPDEWRVMV